MKTSALIIGYGYLTRRLVRHLIKLNIKCLVVTDTFINKFSNPLLSYITYDDFFKIERNNLAYVTHIYYAAGIVDHNFHNPLHSIFFKYHYNYLVLLLEKFNFQNISKVVYFSTSDVYESDSSSRLLDENSNQEVKTSYTLAKSNATSYLLLKRSISNLPIVIIRPFLVYGPDQGDNRLIGYLTSNPMRKKVVQFPKYVRDFLYVDDFIKALMILSFDVLHLKSPVYNICSSFPIELSILKDIIYKYNSTYSIELLDNEEINFKVGDSTLFKNETLWEPKIDLDQGISNILNKQ